MDSQPRARAGDETLQRIGTVPAGEECQVTVRGTRYALCCWGDPAGMPVLALHGWLDNAASFSVLAPLLTGCRVVAPDLAGHGRSEHRPQQGSYHIWDDLPDLLALADALGWRRFALLGHSRGAIMGMLLSVAAASRVRRLAALDGLMPWPVEAPDSPGQLARYVADSGSQRSGKRRCYPGLEAAMAARLRVGDISEGAARRLAYRGLALASGGYCWRADPRLSRASALKLSSAHNAAMLAALRCPLLFLAAQRGVSVDSRAPENRLDSLCADLPDFRLERFPGGHHFHMEESAPALARRTAAFFAEDAGAAAGAA